MEKGESKPLKGKEKMELYREVILLQTGTFLDLVDIQNLDTLLRIIKVMKQHVPIETKLASQNMDMTPIQLRRLSFFGIIRSIQNQLIYVKVSNH